jgi:hypothetical protein
VAESPDFEQEFQVLSAELRKLEGEYNMYFAGRTPRPPIETRSRVDQLFKRWDRRPMDTASSRFRLQTLQSRYSSFVDLWDRALRAREEGRPSPLFRTRDSLNSATPKSTTTPVADTSPASASESDPASDSTSDHTINAGTPAQQQPATAAAAHSNGPRAVTFTDPRAEDDKLQTLYDLLMDARRQAGEGNVPFHKFADLVKEQTNRLKRKGLDEVTFSVTMNDGRVNLTAKGTKPTG